MEHRLFPSPPGRPFSAGKRLSRKRSPQQLAYSIVLILFLFAGVMSSWVFVVPHVYAAGRPQNVPASFTFQKSLQQSHRPVQFGRPRSYPPVPKTKGPLADYAHLPASSEPASMKPISQVLAASFTTAGVTGKPLDLLGSDGRLEVVIQPGSLDISHAAVAGGGPPPATLTLQLSQVHGHFVGQVSGLGGYEVQIVDGKGNAVSGITVRTPVTFIYHYQPWEIASLGLDPGHLLLIWPAQVAAANKAHQSTAPYIVMLHNDAKAHTLTGQSSFFSSGPFVTATGISDNQSPPTPLLGSVGGNTGQLNYSYPIKVPPGPAGFAPQLSLSYSSSEPNARHNYVAPAGDVGDGWSLGLGSISMQTAGTNAAVTGNWYFLNDVANVSDRLVPGSANGFYETQHISRLRIQQITKNGQPCFQVWDKDGTLYEFGCTSDSLEYWTDSSGKRTNYLWGLDRVIAPNENAGAFKLMLITYQQDISHDSSNNATVRDSGISKITYGYSSQTATIDTVVGTVDFNYLAPPYPTKNYNCSSSPPDGLQTTLRCDDPLSRTNSGITVDPPLVMSTMTLTEVISYIGNDSSGVKKAAYRYDFAYQDLPFAQCNDDYTQYAQYCAGEHLLTSVTPLCIRMGEPINSRS